jgi:four helix bundle protein
MEKIKSFEDLMIWQRSHLIVVKLYQITNEFPREELYGITNQIRRAAVSVPNNIAEGFGRYSTKEYIQYLIQARGSLHEVRYLVMLSKNLDYISAENETYLINEINEIGKMLNGMIHSLRKRLSPSNTYP